MTDLEIRKTIEQLLKSIAPDTEPASLKPDENIRRSLAIDSFDFLQFIVKIDETFGIETPEEDYGKLETINNVTSYILNNKH